MTSDTTRRIVCGLAILSCGLAAQAGLEEATKTDRPKLSAKLDTIPLSLGGWVGTEFEIHRDILERTQNDDYLSRVYTNPARPGVALTLWINYSETGLNLRHTPEICLPSGGWAKVESQCRQMEVPREGRPGLPMTRLVYSKLDETQGIGFWYYIFGEGRVEQFVRRLPITSRSSHGRTTRGSGLTVEVFCKGESDPDGEALREFAAALLDRLEPILPGRRAEFFIP